MKRKLCRWCPFGLGQIKGLGGSQHLGEASVMERSAPEGPGSLRTSNWARRKGSGAPGRHKIQPGSRMGASRGLMNQVLDNKNNRWPLHGAYYEPGTSFSILSFRTLLILTTTLSVSTFIIPIFKMKKWRHEEAK